MGTLEIKISASILFGLLGRLGERSTMGEAKRRKQQIGDGYGQEARIISWLPLTASQAEQFVKITTTGAWTGITALVLLWIAVRWLGPAFGWWTTQ
jgi:Protein of unknown function (DUF2839)